MLPKDDNSLNIWESYEQLLDPVTETLPKRYFFPLLTSQLLYCKLSQQPLSLAILEIQNLEEAAARRRNLESDILIKNIISIIKKNLRFSDVLFYNKTEPLILLLPQVNKNSARSLLERITENLSTLNVNKKPLLMKAAFATAPLDTNSPVTLQKCVLETLDLVKKSAPAENRILGYFTEHRGKKRIPLKVEVNYQVTNKKPHLVCSHNLSESGINISGIGDLPLGTNITISFAIPEDKNSKIIAAAVPVWNKINPDQNTTDMGLYFLNLDLGANQLIKNFISKKDQKDNNSGQRRLGKLNIISSALKKYKKGNTKTH